MNAPTPLIDIRPDHWKIVRNILRKHVPQYEVWAFGSRATWKAKEFSDLDLAIITDQPLSLDVSASLNDDFSESDLPWKVDVVDWATTSASFRKIMERDKMVVQEGKARLDIANELSVLPLEDCLDALIDYRGKTPRKTNFGIPLITAKVVKSGRIETPDEFIAEEDYGTWMTRGYPEIGDVVLTTEAPLGEVAQIKFLPVALAQRIVTLRGKRNLLDSGYLLYLMQSQEMQAKLIGRSSGTTVMGIKQSELRKIEVSLPPIAEQRAIAHILGTLDDKIKLNRKQNEVLDAMARTLFKAWFVDFEPVRAKMEGRWQRGQSRPSLPAHLYDIFPDRLVESELGEIPDGWKYAPLRELASTISKGTTPTKDALNNASDTNVTYFLKVRDITEGGEIARNSLELIPISIHENALKRSILRTDDLLFSIAGTIGRVAIVDEDLNNSNCNQAIAFIRLKDKKNFQSLCWFTLRSKRTQDFVESKIVQGVQANASLATIGEIPVLVPNDGVLPAWNEFVRPLMQELKANQSQSRIVTRLRDALLPKLISGDLRVPDAERIVGATV